MRALVIVVIGSLGWAAATVAQEPPPRQADRPRTSLFYEATVAKAIGPGAPSSTGGLHTSWELGIMAPCRANCWGGSMFVAVNDFDGPVVFARTVGLRVRYRHKLGSKAGLDAGLGPIWHRTRRINLDQHLGIGALVAVNYGNWLGVTLQIEALRGISLRTGTRETDWDAYLGLRTSGNPAILVSLLELAVVGTMAGLYAAAY
jgi:hypothetical protein